MHPRLRRHLCTPAIATVRVALACVMMGVLTWACASTDSSPSAPTADVVRLEITGPTRLDPAMGVVNFVATATYVDGTTRTVTTESLWRTVPVPGSVIPVRLGRPGEVDPNGIGEASISASFGGRSATLTVLVLPAGTFKLRGRVTTADGSAPPYVSVRVVSGTGSGRSAGTRAGEFSLYGVAGPLVIETSAVGYLRRTFSLWVDEGTEANLEIPPLVPTTTVAGAWRATLRTSDACVDLPDIARLRSYEASIEQAGAFFTVSLTGPTVRDARSSAVPGVYTAPRGYFTTPEQLTFWLDGPTDFDDNLVGGYLTDRLSATETLEIFGLVTAEVQNGEILARLDGSVTYSNPEGSPRVRRCGAAGTRLIFTRR